MSRQDSEDMLLCQPREGLGCSVCCGLFNLSDISRENLSRFAEKGRERTEEFSTYEDFCEPAEVRDIGSHICPFQGFLAPGKPGCLIHPLSCGQEMRDRSLFSARICGGFRCPAHEVLTGAEKRALVELVDDWYLYSVAIIDPESFRYILKRVQEKAAGPDCGMLKEALSLSLEAHARNLRACGGPLFFYSLPEYNTGKMYFSLPYCDVYRKKVAQAMEKIF